MLEWALAQNWPIRLNPTKATHQTIMRNAILAAALVLGFSARASADDLAQLSPPQKDAVPPAAAPQREAGYGKTDGLIPGMLIGPKLSLVNLPTPGVGVEAKFLGNLLGASFDYGLIPDITVSDVTVGMHAWNVGAKIYPFRGSFFVGALYGNRSFTGSKTDTSTGTPLKAAVDVSSTYVAPELGWRWVWNSGFFMGMDLGWQFVTSSKVTLTAPAGISQGTVDDVQKKGNDIGKAGLPVIGLLQVGFFL